MVIGYLQFLFYVVPINNFYMILSWVVCFFELDLQCFFFNLFVNHLSIICNVGILSPSVTIFSLFSWGLNLNIRC